MMGRQDLARRICRACAGTGQSAKNRKRACPDCAGTGQEWFCARCGGTYGKDCVDTVLDQAHCNKEKP